MQMIRGDIIRNTLLALINKACTLPHLAETHAQLIRNGYQHDLATVTKLTQKLFDVGATRHARALFFSFPNPTSSSSTSSSKASPPTPPPFPSTPYLRRNTTLSPDNFTYAFAIAASPDDNLGMCLHAHAVVDGFSSNLFVASALVDLYYKTDASSNLLVSYSLPYNNMIWSLDPLVALHLRSETFHSKG
ncbi:Pentatricopeptide repeat-containing protein [Spatholobus suberectus]|nr:Pentatricopeptide repeat-containing protein [Spatholobus suberectus]